MTAIELSLPVTNPALASLATQAAKYFEAARADSTRKAYATDLNCFKEFCTQHGLPYLPTTPETIALYVTFLSEHATVSTIRRRLAAINDAHRRARHDPPATPKNHYLLGRVLTGVIHTLGVAQHGAEPIMADAIRWMVAACPQNLLGIRDRALLLLGFASGSRRSELASILEVEDLTFTAQGIYVRMRRSKNDQEKAGRTIAIPCGECPETCPVLAVQTWINAAGITSGALFRAVSRHGRVSDRALSTRAVALILKTAAARAGLDPARISPHGLRAGMISTAAVNGAEERDIAGISGHHSTAVLRRYIRDANLFRNNASARLGL